MYLLPVFLLVFLFSLKRKSVLTFLSSLITISLIGSIFLNNDVQEISFKGFFVYFITAIMLCLIITPWNTYKNIRFIKLGFSRKRFRKVVRFLIIINFLMFVVLSITTIIVQYNVEDIHSFKYIKGANTEFYLTMLPFNIKYLGYAVVLSGLSYFMIPLHFYYLSIKKHRLSLLCFILSFNIILKGSIYFSRYVIIEYILIYIALYLILKGVISKKVKQKLNSALLICLLVFVIYFIGITLNRFTGDRINIPYNSFTKNPVVYSLISYLSQWYYNGYEVLCDYNFINFGGQMTLSDFSNIFKNTGLLPYKPINIIDLKMLLWKDNWYKFTGFSAYAVYDYGIFGGLLFCMSYYYIVRRSKPKQGVLKITDLFLISLLIQIPLMSIFYSQMRILFFPLLFYIIMTLYLKVRI